MRAGNKTQRMLSVSQQKLQQLVHQNDCCISIQDNAMLLYKAGHLRVFYTMAACH